MMITPPVAAAQAGQASGGGLLDSFKGIFGGATGGSTPAQETKGDGSVGLFDGVLGKALMSGALGAGIGFIPIIPGGPILGGIMGALGGAAMGMFSNWRKMSAIKEENQAMLASMGVQTGDPTVQQVLETGNVEQLIPMMEQTMPVSQSGVSATQTGQAVGQEAVPVAVDSSSDPNQSPLPTQATTGQVAVGSGAVSPSVAVDPGVAPTSNGGGGSAGDAGRPPAPVGTNSTDVSAIAPAQAGVDLLDPDSSDLTNAELSAKLVQLQVQLQQLQEFLEAQERAEELAAAA